MDQFQGDVPNPGEIVVCKVTKVLDYGVFVELTEFNNAKGFVHISQVATGWIKNIRNFVKESQIRAAQVLAINTQRNQIDLSFTKVSTAAQKARLEEWKQFTRAKRLIEVLANQLKIPFEDAWDSAAEPLVNEYGSLKDAFQKIALEGEAAAKSVKGQLQKPLVELIQKSIEVPEREKKGTLSLSFFKPNGVELVKKSIQEGVADSKEKKVEVVYLGSGKYLLKAKAFDFKKAEKSLDNAANAILAKAKSLGAETGFAKQED